MKFAVKFASALFLTATPALAHEGIHMHPHGSENWVAGALLIGTCLVVSAAKLLMSKRTEQRA